MQKHLEMKRRNNRYEQIERERRGFAVMLISVVIILWIVFCLMSCAPVELGAESGKSPTVENNLNKEGGLVGFLPLVGGCVILAVSWMWILTQRDLVRFSRRN